METDDGVPSLFISSSLQPSFSFLFFIHNYLEKQIKQIVVEDVAGELVIILTIINPFPL